MRKPDFEPALTLEDFEEEEEWEEFLASQEIVRQSTTDPLESLPYGANSETDLRPRTSIHDLPLDVDPSVLEQ